MEGGRGNTIKRAILPGTHGLPQACLAEIRPTMAGTEPDVIIRSIRKNGNRLSSKLFKRYPLLEHKPDLAAKIVAISWMRFPERVQLEARYKTRLATRRASPFTPSGI